jgi:hypothetical protein
MYQVLSLVALWSFFFLLLISLCLPYVVFYFLPYGFLKEKSISQMPTHIIIIANVSNVTVFSIPIIVSVVMYAVLAREVRRRKQESARSDEVFSIQGPYYS